MLVDKTRMENTKSYGFTLIELLVALAVASILLGIGIPSFSNAIKNSRVSADYNELTYALYLARSEAIKTADWVSVCPRKAVDSMECGTDIAHWKNGWIVFRDSTRAAAANSASIDPDDEIIAVHPEPVSGNSIRAIGATDRQGSDQSERTYISYRSSGGSDWASGTFTMCDTEVPERSRALNVAPTGDVRPGRRSDSEYPRDAWGQEACNGP